MLNFDTLFEEEYETRLQKVHIFIIYLVGYISIPIMLYNSYTRSGQAYFYIAHNPPLPIPLQVRILLYASYFLLILSFVNVFFADSYRKKDPYGIDKTFLSFVLINFFILAPLSLFEMVSFFNELFFIIFILNAI